MCELPPFETCLRCNKLSFGTFPSAARQSQNNTKKCRYSHDEVLPGLNKQVVYLDQFAVSELFKTKTRRPVRLTKNSGRTATGSLIAPTTPFEGHHDRS